MEKFSFTDCGLRSQARPEHINPPQPPSFLLRPPPLPHLFVPRQHNTPTHPVTDSFHSRKNPKTSAPPTPKIPPHSPPTTTHKGFYFCYRTPTPTHYREHASQTPRTKQAKSIFFAGPRRQLSQPASHPPPQKASTKTTHNHNHASPTKGKQGQAPRPRAPRRLLGGHARRRASCRRG